MTMNTQELPLAALRANGYNFNEMPAGQLKALASEVKARGYVMHHIVARQDGDAYIIIDGEHQWRAAQMAGLETVPVQVVPATQAEAIAETYRRNGLRGEANRVKLARAIFLMMRETPDETGAPLSNVKASKVLGRTEAWLRTTLQYGELADLFGHEGFPSEDAVAKMTEKDVKAWLAFSKGTGPNPNGGDEVEAEGAGGAPAEDDDPLGVRAENKEYEDRAKALSSVIKKLAKMTTEDRAQVAAAIRRLDKEAKKNEG